MRKMQSESGERFYAWRDAVEAGIEELERELTEANEKVAALEKERQQLISTGWSVVGSFGRARGKHIKRFEELLSKCDGAAQQPGEQTNG